MTDDIREAENIISEFVKNEYDETADFSDKTNVGIACTNTEDELHTITATADLINYKIIKKIDDTVIEEETYSTFAEFKERLLDLDFSELTYMDESRFSASNIQKGA